MKERTSPLIVAWFILVLLCLVTLASVALESRMEDQRHAGSVGVPTHVRTYNPQQTVDMSYLMQPDHGQTVTVE